MLDDIIYKLMRKSLPKGFYGAVSQFINKKNLKTRALAEIHGHYCEQGLNFQTGTVLELGSGNQFITAFFYLQAGAKQVLLVDPKLEPSSFEENAKQFRLFSGKLPAEDAQSRIRCFKDLQEIPSEFNGIVDVICSFTVLEHVRDMTGCFANHHRLLADSGIAYHRVDLLDHTYHVFGKFKATRWILAARALHHMRYSNKVFAFLNDDESYINRVLLPSYLQLAAQNRLDAKVLKKDPHPEIPIHPDLLLPEKTMNPEDLFISGFAMELRKQAAVP